jgi:iron-sulfur cluster repair protein YtfE (RIC family)
MKKKFARRHHSLIPLSREHQYALLVCLRIHRGLPEHNRDHGWLRAKASNAARFFDADLTIHFQAEEQHLFPAMEALPGARQIISDLLDEHVRIRQLADRLRAGEGSLENTLKQFADLLESHIRKEERVLFPLFEQQAPAEMISAIEKAILLLIGSAARPKHPELLA